MVLKDKHEHMFNIDDVSCVSKYRDGIESEETTWYFIYIRVAGTEYKLEYRTDKAARDADYDRLKSTKQY